jgi:ABC-2 type transport system permease protein
VSPFVEIRLIALREVGKSIRSVKGIILGVLTLIGAFAASLVCVYVEGKQRASAGVDSTEAFTAFKHSVIASGTGNDSLAGTLASAPTSLLIFFQITIWLAPLLVALLGFDLVSAEFQHRSVRYWTVRARRSSYFLGKYFGLFGIVASVTLLLNVLAGIVVLAKGYAGFGDLIVWGGKFWLVSLPITMVWAAIATFISSRFKTPILALLSTFGVFFVLWLLGIGGLIARLAMASPGDFPPMSWYEYLYPNNYDQMLLSHEPTKVAMAIGILFGFSAVMGAAGSLLFARRDV